MRRGPSTRVAIIGAGPAGLATALMLGRQHVAGSVIVVARTGRPPARAGETFPPTAEPLLRRLGVWEAFLRDEHQPSFGSLAAWGRALPAVNEYFLHPYQRGWHVDRRRFDATLMAQAREQGVEFVSSVGLVETNRRTDGGWRLRLETGEGERRESSWVDADFAVDATGRRAEFARRQGVRRRTRDGLIGAIVVFDAAERPREWDRRSLVEACEEGWWSVAGLPGGRQIAAFMTDHDLARRLGLRSAERWHAMLARTTQVRARLAGATPLGGPSLHAAQSGSLELAAGERWLAVGDAASTVDPLSSLGVFKALRSGILASYAIRDAVGGRAGSFPKYAALVQAEYESYLRARADYYEAESRWPEAPFWRRRHGAQAFPSACERRANGSPQTAGRAGAERKRLGAVPRSEFTADNPVVSEPGVSLEGSFSAGRSRLIPGRSGKLDGERRAAMTRP